MPTQLLVNQRTILGIFAYVAGAAGAPPVASYVDPTTYTFDVKSSSSTPPPTVTLTTSPAAVVLSDGNGNEQNVAVGDKVWILDALPEGADVVVGSSGLPNSGTAPDIEFTTAATSTTTFGNVSVQLPPGV